MIAASVEPEDDSASEFEASDLSDTPLSDPESSGLSSEESEYASNPDSSNFKKSKSKKPIAKPKFRSRFRKVSGKGKTTVSGDEDEDEDEDAAIKEENSMAEEDLDALDEETRMTTLKDMKEKRREKKKADEERLAPIKKEEARMKKELGRKLTNGERNIIRLVRVGIAFLLDLVHFSRV